MPRQIRCIIPKIPHHAMQRGNNHQNIFFNKEDKSYFCKNLEQYSKEQKVYIGAYCLMTNHFHLLLYPDTEQGLSNFMKLICQKHTQHINRKHKRSGKLWENRYKLYLVDPDYTWMVSRYIELNPVRARIVNNPVDYHYSSARKNLNKIPDRIVNIDIIKGRHKDYQDFMKEKIEESEIKSIHEALQQNKALGKEGFIKKLEDKFKNTSFKTRKRGRPVNKK
jgi:putative transposase